MAAADPSSSVVRAYDAETVQRILTIASLVGFSVAIVAAIGELLGWWNDLGEIALAAGTLVGALAGVGALTTSSTRDQASSVASAVGVANTKLDHIDGKLGKLDKLDKLDQLDRLEKLDQLDVIQVKLDAHTGVLDRQVNLLRQIRDRL